MIDVNYLWNVKYVYRHSKNVAIFRKKLIWSVGGAVCFVVVCTVGAFKKFIWSQIDKFCLDIRNLFYDIENFSLAFANTSRAHKVKMSGVHETNKKKSEAQKKTCPECSIEFGAYKNVRHTRKKMSKAHKKKARCYKMVHDSKKSSLSF